MEFAFNLGDQAVGLRVNLALRVEKSAALGVALRLKGLDLFLAGEFGRVLRV